MGQPTLDPDAPLKGVAGNLNKQSFTAIAWVCFAVSTFFVVLRLFVRFRHNHNLFPDDFWLIAAWVCYLTMLIIQMMQLDALWYTAAYFSGHYTLNNPTMFYQATQLLRWQFPISTLFLMTLWSVKASFLATFYRLVYPLRWARRSWWVVLAFTAGSFVGCIFTMLFMCDTPSEFFTPGHCQKPGNFMHVFAIGFATGVDVVADLMIVALSLAVLRTLQLDKSKKWGVAAAFSLVVMIIMAAKLRVELVVDNEEFDMVGLAIWSVVETMTALIVGSLMPLSGLLSKAISKISSNRSKSRRYPQRIDDQDSRSVQLEDSASNTGLFRKSRASRSVTVIGGAGSSNEQITKDNYSTSDGDELALNSTTSHRWRSGV